MVGQQKSAGNKPANGHTGQKGHILMKETHADDLKKKNIRTTSELNYDVPVHSDLVITRLDTGERVENVTGIHIEAKAGGTIWVTLTLVHIEQGYKELRREAVCVENPELNLIARSHPQDNYDITMSSGEAQYYPTY